MPRMTQEEYRDWQARNSGARGIPLLDTLIEGVAEAPAGTELELHNEIIRECRRRNWVYVHSNPTQKATNRPGTPDFIIYADRGRMLHAEVKTASGKLSKAQEQFQREIERLGHFYHEVRSIKKFLEIANHP